MTLEEGTATTQITPDETNSGQEAESHEESATTAGHIHDLGLLDLRFAKTPEDLSHITRISDVGMVLISESMAPALMKIPINDVGTVVHIPDGVQVNCLTGQTRISGEALASGDPASILFIAGQFFVTSPITSIGYKEVRVAGQLFAPRGSEAALTAKLTQLTGQILYLPDNPRLVMGEESFGKAFLELLPEPTSMVIMGQVTFDDDVTVELVRSKLTEIVLMGQIHAPAALLPILQVITKEKMGQISAK
jgi:hypothetical protein